MTRNSCRHWPRTFRVAQPDQAYPTVNTSTSEMHQSRLRSEAVPPSSNYHANFDSVNNPYPLPFNPLYPLYVLFSDSFSPYCLSRGNTRPEVVYGVAMSLRLRTWCCDLRRVYGP